MITDEQVYIACDIYDKLSGIDAAEPSYMRKTLEAYEQSKWVEFDADDDSTWPPMTKQPYASLPVMVYCANTDDILYGVKFVTNMHKSNNPDKHFAHWQAYDNESDRIDVTHWQPLPTFKE